MSLFDKMTLKHKIKRVGVWQRLGINEKERERLYSRNRLKAKEMLARKHKKEYSQILNGLMVKEFKSRIKECVNVLVDQKEIKKIK